MVRDLGADSPQRPPYKHTMFGYTTINKSSLPEADYQRFRGWYCGLCRELRLRHGGVSRLTLTYDMTFLYLLLSALYEPDTGEVWEKCAASPRKKHLALSNEFGGYCADMNVMLSYFQCLDDAADEKKLAGKAGAAVLKRPFQAAIARWPRQYQAARSAIGALSALESSGAVSLDAPANLMGDLLGEIYVYRDDFFAPDMREMGRAMGRYVYLLDAYCDMEQDEKTGSYNPFLPLKGRPDFEAYAEAVLKMTMADCAAAFERMPILSDAGLIRNILYSGVWSGYADARRRRNPDAKPEK